MARGWWALVLVALVGCGASAGESPSEQIAAVRQQIEETARLNHETITRCADTVRQYSATLDQCVEHLRTSTATVEMLTQELIRTRPMPVATP